MLTTTKKAVNMPFKPKFSNKTPQDKIQDSKNPERDILDAVPETSVETNEVNTSGGFESLNLHKDILKAIKDAGYTSPTLIQEKAIPVVLSGQDIMASAQTGTGKTAAFILPALDMLMSKTPGNGQGPRLLILVPTRELAMQVSAEAIKYSKYLPRMKTVCIYGGTPYPIQNRQLSSRYEILVATPGRLIDHLERGRINFSRLEMLVLDEADRMLDMGFIEPVEQIAAATPESRQTLLFSATLRGSVLKLTKSLLKNPATIAVTPDKARHENIDQRLHYVDNLQDKQRCLETLLTTLPMEQAIVFTSTKRQADILLDSLLDKGLRAAALHGDMNQRQRTRTIGQLRDGDIQILVATDVAARGIDVQTISHVINFDLPQSGEDYVHRIGRTGRAGAKGVALSFAAPKDIRLLRQIEQFTGQKLIAHDIPGMKPRTAPTSPAYSSDRGDRGDRARSPYPSRGRKPAYGQSSYGGGDRSERSGSRKPYGSRSN